MARAIHVFRTPDRFVAGTVGQPGNRTFYLQAVHDKRVISVILEKQQVAVLAERIAALLLEINRRFGTPIPPDSGDIVLPLAGGNREAVTRHHFTGALDAVAHPRPAAAVMVAQFAQ